MPLHSCCPRDLSSGLRYCAQVSGSDYTTSSQQMYDIFRRSRRRIFTLNGLDMGIKVHATIGNFLRC